MGPGDRPGERGARRPAAAPGDGLCGRGLREFGADQPDTLVHGDLHFADVLRAEREPWPAIDPKGLVGDPAYDGLALLRSHPDFRARRPIGGRRRTTVKRNLCFRIGPGLLPAIRSSLGARTTRKPMHPCALGSPPAS
ncbi:aminoglycoside phosphotransferase family protein [Kitasatospora paranensis]|uniref:Aminoglycoside phosphotransferase family protein n=1 Tax=Kitasatospora paranensis TaxID=258053 RepID=A0ABW2FTH4_9ACTN